MKGIILAGGTGSRLYPITKAVVKQLLPIYDKPLIYYPLSTLIEAGITDVLIICAPKDKNAYENLFGKGENFGINIQYKEQIEPKGIAEAFTLGEDFINNEPVWLILGDNIFVGDNLETTLKTVEKTNRGCTVFSYRVKDPQRYGVIEFDKDNRVVSIEEKPKEPKSEYAQVGLYYFDNKVIEIAKKQKPSKRNELEIVDTVNVYLKKEKVDVVTLPKGTVWLDTGTNQSLYDASDFVRVIQERQNTLIGSPEIEAYDQGLITKEQLYTQGRSMEKTNYGQYLINKAKGNHD